MEPRSGRPCEKPAMTQAPCDGVTQGTAVPTASGMATRLLTECESCIFEDSAINMGRSTFKNISG